MKARMSDIIDFPANPFVAFADFLIVLLMVLILAVLHQSVSSSRLIERVAVANQQEGLLQACMNSGDNVLSSAISKEHFMKTNEDGDLQRFWLDGAISFTKGSSAFSPQQPGARVLHAFALILAGRQGTNEATGAFKRIIVEGHADKTEIVNNSNFSQRQIDDMVWQLSLARADTAAKILLDAGIQPWRVEVSGRGQWARDSGPSEDVLKRQTQAQHDAFRQRVDIVVIYSGPLALEKK